MNRRAFVGTLSRGSLGLLGGTAALRHGLAAPPMRRKPNFVFILADDLGWADLPAYGNTFTETPNIDRLASQGMRFTDAYAACPVCSPTRASILTGRYPATVNLTDFIAGHWRPYARLNVPEFNLQLPLEESTIAEALKPAGYASASIGKWHLGGKDSQPSDHGFDVSITKAENLNDKWVASLTAAALEFIEANRDNPFFLYLSHHTVHIPLQARQALIQKYEATGASGEAPCDPTYAAMIETLDESVGQVMGTLDELGLSDDTVLIFFSDNGGLSQRFDRQGQVVTSNAPLRDEKGTLYEGGIRVPMIVRWPGRIPRGSVCRVPVTSVDFFPTMLEMADVEGEHAVDGRSLAPILTRQGKLRRDAIYWHYPHYHHSTPAGAIRQGKHKLIELYEDGALELYDLRSDIGEQHNLAEEMPRRAEEMRAKLAAWRESVNARMPTPNPNYDEARAHEWGDRRKKPK